MEVRVPQEVPGLGILGIPCHQVLQQPDRIGAPVIDGSTGLERECLSDREPFGDAQRPGCERPTSPPVLRFPPSSAISPPRAPATSGLRLPTLTTAHQT